MRGHSKSNGTSFGGTPQKISTIFIGQDGKESFMPNIEKVWVLRIINGKISQSKIFQTC